MQHPGWKFYAGIAAIGVGVAVPALWPAVFGTVVVEGARGIVDALFRAAPGQTASIGGSFLADGVTECFERDEGPPDSPHNHHLTLAVGRAFAEVLSEHAHRPEIAGSVKSVGQMIKRAPEAFRALLIQKDIPLNDVIDVPDLLKMASRDESIPAVGIVQDWEEWLGRIADACGVSLDSSARTYLAAKLRANLFEKVRRELKRDFADGGKAYAAFHMLCLGRLLDGVGRLLEQNRAILDEVKATADDVREIKERVIDRSKEIRSGLAEDERLALKYTFDEVIDQSKKLVAILFELQGLRAEQARQGAEQKRQGELADDTNAIVRKLLEREVQRDGEMSALRDEMASKDRQNAELKDAVNRMKAAAESGDTQAAAALAEARTSGDWGRLQAVLIRLRDDRVAAIAREMDEAIKESREIAAIAYLRGDIAEAERSLDVILKADPNDLDALNRLGHVLDLRGDLHGAEQRYKRLLELAGQDELWRAVALGNLGVIANTRGDIDAAEKHFRDALDINRKLGRLEGQASQLGNLGVIARARGNLDAAEKLIREALGIFYKLGSLEGRSMSLGNLGVIELTLGNHDTAEKHFRDALKIERKLGRPEGEGSQLGNLGLVAEARGDLATAEKHFRDALEIERKLGRRSGQAEQLGRIGVIMQAGGDLDAAEMYFRDALAIDRKLGKLEGQAIRISNLGGIALIRGDLDAAEKLFAEALAINQKLDRLEGQAIQLANLGSIAAQRKEFTEARRAWMQSRDLYAKIGISHMVKQVQAWLDSLP